MNIAIFASGSGTNAECIGNYFDKNPNAEVRLILTNKKDAGVIKRAENLGIRTIIFNKMELYETTKIADILEEEKIDLVVLAGFLLLIPENLLEKYPGRILNIHPALLPKYGGKGMYGKRVHEAVIENGEQYSGISIHFVNEKYDDGQIIFQDRLEVMPDDTPDSLASKIHQLEYKHYPRVIEDVLLKLEANMN